MLLREREKERERERERETGKRRLVSGKAVSYLDIIAQPLSYLLGR